MFDQEAYCGRLVLQKTFREAFGSRAIPNDGQMTKYIVDNAHEAIVSPAYFDQVRQEKKARAKRRRSKHEAVAKLQGKVYCDHCGLDMVMAVERKPTQEKRVRYYCRTRDRQGKGACPSRTLTEEQLFTALGGDFDSESIQQVYVNSDRATARLVLTGGQRLVIRIKKGGQDEKSDYHRTC